MYAPERQVEILSRARANGRVNVAALAEYFDVTQETIRRDLTTLERLGEVRRVHGGAIAIERLADEPAIEQRDQANTGEKEAIAARAILELPDGGTVLIDAGTTTSRLVGLIPHDRQLVVVTHSLPIASMLSHHPNVTLHVLGGQLRARTLAGVGPWTLSALRGLHADVAFVGTNAITAAAGLSTPDLSEAEVKRAIIAASSRAIVLADHSKFGRQDFAIFAQAADIDTVITDGKASPEFVQELEETDVRVVRA